MKININSLNIIPHKLSNGKFGLCCYGEISEELKEWADYHSLPYEFNKGFTNFYPENKNWSELFEECNAFEYIDGFSPNLNKDLHLGHFSNLVLAKAFQSLGVGNKYIAILGDTLSGTEEKYFQSYLDTCNAFGYVVDEVHYASKVEVSDKSLLIDGSGDFEGTKGFVSGEDYIVGLKSNGNTSYFYQDVALAQHLDAPTLYLTGYEQIPHFKSLKNLFPDIEHIGLGLVKTNVKMSSSLGNVIYMNEFIQAIQELFNCDEKLAYNIFAGFILKASPSSDKKLKLGNSSKMVVQTKFKVEDAEALKNPKTSPGLYLSYTLARLKSAGVSVECGEDFNDIGLSFSCFKAKANLNPATLFNELSAFCKQINVLYGSHKIQGNKENEKMFEFYMHDLQLGMKKLGMMEVDKV